MSFIGSMVSAAMVAAEMGTVAATIGGIAATGAVGAGLGAGVSALTGGDIGKGALYGGIGGALSGGLSGLAGATAGAEATGYGATSLGSPLAGTAESLAPNIAAPLTQGTSQIAPLTQGTSQIAPQAVGNSGVSQALNLRPMASEVANVTMSPTTPAGGLTNAINTLPAGNVPELSLGQQAMSHLTSDPSMVKYGGSALQGAVTGAGMQGVGNLLQGKPITSNMGIGALSGAAGGAGAEALAGIGGKVGQFATDNKTLTAAGLGLMASPIVSSLVDPQTGLQTPQTQGLKPDFTWNPNAYHRATVTRGYANGGGISDLGGYSDGGQLLRGPGDGVSDSIPASINGKQPARLADGEFVVPARIVSELGNGSTEAGSRRLYDMVHKVEADRQHTIGHGNIAKNTHAYRNIPV